MIVRNPETTINQSVLTITLEQSLCNMTGQFKILVSSPENKMLKLVVILFAI